MYRRTNTKDPFPEKDIIDSPCIYIVYVQQIENRKLFVHNGFFFQSHSKPEIFIIPIYTTFSFQLRILMDRIVGKLSWKTTQVINKMANEGVKEKAREGEKTNILQIHKKLFPSSTF